MYCTHQLLVAGGGLGRAQQPAWPARGCYINWLWVHGAPAMPDKPGTDYEAAARDAGPSQPTYNNNDARQNFVVTKSALQPTRDFVATILTTIKPVCCNKLDLTNSQGPQV